MKEFLNKTIKVKHVLIILVLLFTMSVGFVLNRSHFPRHKEMAKVEQRNVRPQMRNQWNGQSSDFKNLSDVEKASIDSLRSLIKRGDHENNMIIFKQIHGIVKK